MYESFKADASGAQADFTIDVEEVNGKMTVMTHEYPVYITKEQAMKFFDLVPRITR